MADLNTDVRYIKGIGEAKAKSLGKLGIATLGDLINWFPRRYEDRREIKPISQLIPGEPAWRRYSPPPTCTSSGNPPESLHA